MKKERMWPPRKKFHSSSFFPLFSCGKFECFYLQISQLFITILVSSLSLLYILILQKLVVICCQDIAVIENKTAIFWWSAGMKRSICPSVITVLLPGLLELCRKSHAAETQHVTRYHMKSTLDRCVNSSRRNGVTLLKDSQGRALITVV